MKLLVIDNYDSFTFNLVHLLAEIIQDEPHVYKNNQITWEAIEKEHYDAIVLSPGPGRPDRLRDFGVCRDVIQKSNAPLLGVCLSHQGIALFAGAKVDRAPTPMHGRTSSITHSGTGIFRDIPSPLNVARYHSLIVHQPLPSTLEATAWTDDGLIMALAHRHRPQWGVQFHPESIITNHGRKLLQNFCEEAQKRSANGKRSSACQFTPKIKTVPTSSSRRAFWRELSHEIDVEAAFCSMFANSSCAFWLDSNLIEAGRGRWSYIGNDLGPNAASLHYRCGDKALVVRNAAGCQTQNNSIFDYFERIPATRPSCAPPVPFLGGHIGWFGYELRHECGSPISRSASTPDAFFIYSDRFIAVDHVEHKTYLIAIDSHDNGERATRWLDHVEATLEKAERSPINPPRTSPKKPLHIVLQRDKATYLSNIKRCLDWIGQGETYQVCLTNELVCSSEIEPLELYRTMRKVNPAHYAAFIKWPGGAVLSASPERFLTIDPEGRVETKPIKGTIKRDTDEVHDLHLAEQLRTSEKDRAENVMIVDLLRNDLAQNCRPGTINVPKLFDIESYQTVHQLVSTVRGDLLPRKSTISLIRGAFPGGSITGAPKIRTMELIDRLEKRPRGIYSGALGWLGDDGAADLNIAIRTIVATPGRLSIGIGGGIVAASTPEEEFAEMLLKAEASIKSIVIASTGGFSPADYELVDIEETAPKRKNDTAPMTNDDFGSCRSFG